MPGSEPPPGHSLEELYEDAPCGFLSLGADGTILRVNRTFLRSTGHDAGQVVGRRLHDLLAPASRLFHATHWGPLLALHGEVAEIPVDLVRADGSRLSVLFNATLTRGADGEVSGIRASCFDATDRRRYERELLAARDQQATVARLGGRALEGVPLPELLAEAAMAARQTAGADFALIAEAGVGAVARSGWPRDAPAGPELAFDEALLQRLGVRDTLRVPVGGAHDAFGELVLHARDAGRLGEMAANVAEAIANVVWSAVERERVDALRRHQAHHDPLTGLPNRLLLGERLTELIARARDGGGRFALCLLDLDLFKLVNDTLGHHAGDDLLRAVAARLREVVRGADLVCRLGGDEFVLLCGEIGSIADAEALAERVAAALAPPFALEGAEHVVTASVGVVVGDGASSADGVLRDADVAMYRAKERGRGQHAHFDQSMRERAQERVRVEAELRLALQRGELRVFYQPVVAARDGAVVGMEALVRWQHPQHGLVGPGAFIPVAEECGLIVDVGRFVMDRACRDLAAWRDEGLLPPGAGVAVNISARQLAQPGLAGEVRALLEETGLSDTPQLLGLEITETVLMGTTESPAVALEALAALGVGLLLDDFGTGTSSLARLKRFPVDTLKVDRAFVSGLGGGDGEDDAIVAAIMAMARALGLQVVAEGVETALQLDRLTELGCERIQGFLFARPMPAPAMREQLLRPLAA